MTTTDSRPIVTHDQSSPIRRADGKWSHASCEHPKTTWCRRQCRRIQRARLALARQSYQTGWKDGRKALLKDMTEIIARDSSK
jgi:hypothetical protein